jgi:predicted PurR-regulated permease PerM
MTLTSNSGGDTPVEPTRRLMLAIDIRVAVGVTVALLAGYALFAVVRDADAMLTRLAIGLVLALALDGLVNHLQERFRISRLRAVLVVTTTLFVLGVAVVVALGPPAVSQARDLATNLPKTVRELYKLPLVGGFLERAHLATKVDQYVAQLPATVSTQGVTNAAKTLLGGVVSVLIVVTTTIAILLDGERLVALFRRAIPPARREQADRVGRIFHSVVGRYFGGSITVAVMMGLYVLTISLIFGVPLAPLAAVWAMITDLIPQVGGLLGGAFLVVLALTAGPGTAVIVLLLFVIYMNVENHLIQPAIIGNAVNLSPPTTMLAALIGGAAAGIPGALVATPLVGAVKQLYFSTRHPDAVADAAPPGLLTRARGLLHRGRPDPDR